MAKKTLTAEWNTTGTPPVKEVNSTGFKRSAMLWVLVEGSKNPELAHYCKAKHGPLSEWFESVETDRKIAGKVTAWQYVIAPEYQ